jgi:hypothetical protein
MNQYSEPRQALEYLRTERFGEEITYERVGVILSSQCGKPVSKAEAWNAEHRDKRVAPHIRDALVNMGLLVVSKRWRFFFEVDEKTYHHIVEFLDGETFTQHMKGRDNPWD